jgi:hypothetical protein
MQQGKGIVRPIALTILWIRGKSGIEMFRYFRRLPRPVRILAAWLLVGACLLGFIGHAAAQGIVINEVGAAPSTRALRQDAFGQPALGAAVAWHAFDFMPPSHWRQGVGPVGFGTESLGTDLGAPTANKALSFYLRASFDLTEAEVAAGDALQLAIDYNDGFVAYLNGREIARRGLGAAGSFVFADQPAFNARPATGEEIIDLGDQAAQLLRPGRNVLAIQVHNHALASYPTIPDYIPPGIERMWCAVTLRAGGPTARPLVQANDTFAYVVGTHEPSGGLLDPADFSDDASGAGAAFYDWIELYNPSSTPVSLHGWSLTNRSSSTNQWLLPADTFIEPDGYLVIACSGGARQSPGGLLHAGFSLDADAPYLALHDASGRLVSELTGMPPRDSFHTWGRVAETDRYHYHAQATPGAANRGDTGATARTAPPVPDHDSGYHRGPLRVTLTSDTPEAVIRYTLDGSEPTPANGHDYTVPIDPVAGPGPGLGYALREAWFSVPYSQTALPVRPADTVSRVDQLEAPLNVGNSYVQRISGFLHAPATGTYTFWLSSDDRGQFWLSGDSTRDGLRLRCQINGWTPFREFNTPGEPGQRSEAVELIAGQAYYFEALQAEDAAGDTLGVAWTGPGFPSVTIVAGRWLSPPADLPADFGTQPTSGVVRARAFAPNHLPSEIITRTYAVDYPDGYRALASIFLAGEAGQTFYPPNGVFSQVGGRHVDAVWEPVDPGTDYNFCLVRGRAFERPVEFEYVPPGAMGFPPDAVRTTTGLRFAGSSWSRTRQTMLHLEPGAWLGDWFNKPQMNVHFRGDFGLKSLQREGFIPGSTLRTWESFRLRAGKNDPYNPFILDEFMRRLFHAMGADIGHHPSSVGLVANLFVNGRWKGHYNLTERLREAYFKEFYGSDNSWDVNASFIFESGDDTAYREMIDWFLSHPLDNPAHYQTATTYWDPVNVADYILLNAWAGTLDWPENNFVCARERRPGALWRFSLWDAEAAFGTFGQPPDHNTFVSQLLVPETTAHDPPIETDQIVTRLVFRRFCQNPQFRLLFADRLQRHCFNEGALAEGPLAALYHRLREPMSAGLQAATGQTFSQWFWNDWLGQGSGRTAVILEQARAAGLWPGTRAPSVVPAGGRVTPGTLAHLDPGPDGGTVYFTTDGTDPRSGDGSAAGESYIEPIAIVEPFSLKARVLREGEWSPLLQADYEFSRPHLLVTEIHYNPPGAGDETEFLEITNAGLDAARLHGARFTSGIHFVFGEILLPPGARLVLAADADAFAATYPTVALAGVYSGRLSNEGETLTLVSASGELLFSVTYGDSGTTDWPAEPDGNGPSLVLKYPFPEAGEAADLPTRWRRSAAIGGFPGGVDSTSFMGADPDADEDGDGWSSFMEYALGTSDERADSIPSLIPEIAPDGRWHLHATRNPTADDIMLEAEISTSMQHWENLIHHDEWWSAGGLTTRWIAPPTTAEQPFLFIRILAIRLPDDRSKRTTLGTAEYRESEPTQ